MIYALEAAGLGKRYGRKWALQDCDIELPAGRVTALVGPNGAGKTTLLRLAAGLAQPSAGDVRVFGYSPHKHRIEALSRLGFVAQDHPLYRGFTVAETLTLGRKLNPRWDETVARTRLNRLEIPMDRPVGKLSGGQQAQVALALALAKRPDLLLLDEPIASLDPLARHEFLSTLMDAVAEGGLTVLLSSHIITDLERVCDYLVLLSVAHVQLAGDIETIVGSHKLLVGQRQDVEALAHVHRVVQVSHTERQTTVLIQANGPILDPTWDIRDVTLEEIVLAYLRQTAGQQMPPMPEQVAGGQRVEEVTR